MINRKAVHLATVVLTMMISLSSSIITHCQAAVVLPKTGQTLCYNAAGGLIACDGTGQDGFWLMGSDWPLSRFTDPGNGTVIDELTGLVWLKDANCFGGKTWPDALTSSNTLASGSCGLSDGSTANMWRLPNRTELESLVDLSTFNPALPAGHPFSNVHTNPDLNVVTSYYWTSSNRSTLAFVAGMYAGNFGTKGKTPDSGFVWPVRITLPTLTVTASAVNGTISPSSQSVVSGDWPVPLAVTPDTGYYLDSNIPLGGTCPQGGFDGPYYFGPIYSNCTVVAAFSPLPYTLYATAGANGSVTPTSQQVYYDSTGSITVTPNPGYQIATITGCGGTLNGTTYTTGTITGDCTVNATFSVALYPITATAEANGSITPTGTTNVIYNGSQSYSITPATGYHIADVLVDGVSVGAVTSYTFSNVITSHTISASFAINSYPITATAGANGSITPVGATNINHNGSQSYSITPTTGYHIADVLVDGVSVGAVADYTFSNVITSHTISASFVDITPPIIIPVPEQIYNEVTSNKNYRIAGTVTDVSSVTVKISVDDIIYTPPVAPDGSYFQDVTLVAEKSYMITITATDAMGLKSQKTRTVVYSPITIADALRAYKIAQGFIIPTKPDDYNLLDVAPLGTDGRPLGNGKIDLFDVLSLLNKSIGMGY